MLRFRRLFRANLGHLLMDADKFRMGREFKVDKCCRAQTRQRHGNAAGFLKAFSNGAVEDIIDELVRFAFRAAACLNQFNGFFEKAVVAFGHVVCNLDAETVDQPVSN